MDPFQQQKERQNENHNLFRNKPSTSNLNSSIPTSNTETNQSSFSSSTTTQREDPFFRVRIINIDHVFEQRSHLDRSHSAFAKQGVQLQEVPVIRIFGATPLGQRVCLHVHDVFPYCYIEYKESLEPSHVHKYISTLGRQLNQAAFAARGQKFEDLTKQDFIIAIHLCKGTPFYGYHLGWKYFLKISFRDPKKNNLLAGILESGNLMNNTKFQPYEIHVRYLLQFFLDYNLYGCDYIDLRKCLFRDSLPDPEENPYHSSSTSKQNDIKTKFWDKSVIPPNSEFMNLDVIRKVSFCQLEIDSHASWIENRKYLSSRSDQHQKIYEKDSLKKNQKLVPSLIDLWTRFNNNTSTSNQNGNDRESMSLKPSSTLRPDYSKSELKVDGNENGKGYENGKGKRREKGKEKAPESTARIFKKGEQHPPGGIDFHNEERFEKRLESDESKMKRRGLDPKDLQEEYFLKRSAQNRGSETYDRWICTTFDSVPLFHAEFRKKELENEREKERVRNTQIGAVEVNEEIKTSEISSKETPKKSDEGVGDNPFTPDRIDFVSSQRSSGNHNKKPSQSSVSNPSSAQNSLGTPTRSGRGDSSQSDKALLPDSFQAQDGEPSAQDPEPGV